MGVYQSSTWYGHTQVYLKGTADHCVQMEIGFLVCTQVQKLDLTYQTL